MVSSHCSTSARAAWTATGSGCSREYYRKQADDQAACLIRREVQQNGTGALIVEDAYIQGDIIMQRF